MTLEIIWASVFAMSYHFSLNQPQTYSLETTTIYLVHYSVVQLTDLVCTSLADVSGLSKWLFLWSAGNGGSGIALLTCLAAVWGNRDDWPKGSSSSSKVWASLLGGLNIPKSSKKNPVSMPKHFQASAFLTLATIWLARARHTESVL